VSRFDVFVFFGEDGLRHRSALVMPWAPCRMDSALCDLGLAAEIVDLAYWGMRGCVFVANHQEQHLDLARFPGTSAKTAPVPWERSPMPRPQFSLKAMLITLTVVGISVGVLANRARRQRDAVAALIAAGGAVMYDYNFDANHVQIPDAKPAGPTWLRKIVGDHFLDDVVFVYLGGCHPTDGDLKQLAAFEKLDWLYLSGLAAEHITDRQIAYLSSLSRLRSLDLGSTEITDAGLAHLARLPSLRWLDLQGTSITDAGTCHLRRMVGLEDVYLANTKISPHGLAELRLALPNCRFH
jgi:hypothetical protein